MTTPAFVMLVASFFATAFTVAARAAESLSVAGATFNIDVDTALQESNQELREWVARSAGIVSAYYGRFPASEVDVRMKGSAGRGVQGGETTNWSGAAISLRVGSSATRRELTSDWVLVHEMVHLALPEVGRRHAWLSEGLATYVEGIARAQAGNRPVEDVWAEFTRSMPLGLPQPGEGGLDQTHTWGRTYWGGALFCLLADVSIRERTHNKQSLRDALAAILQATGGYAGPSAHNKVDIKEVFAIGDKATHTTVLTDLYAALKESPQPTDLPALWTRLGVRGEGARASFDESAPLAALRASITAPVSRVSPAVP
ncbi:MAG: hypothetical protein ABI885_06150 [Gammaproteobacteria bacterium]